MGYDNGYHAQAAVDGKERKSERRTPPTGPHVLAMGLLPGEEIVIRLDVRNYASTEEAVNRAIYLSESMENREIILVVGSQTAYFMNGSAITL